MTKKFALVSLALLAACAGIEGAQAGTEMITDNSARSFPPPRRVYYAPPPPMPVPVPVVGVYPRRYFYRPGIRFYGYHRWHRYPFRHWR